MVEHLGEGEEAGRDRNKADAVGEIIAMLRC
jgi:hypothetical protein